MHLLDISKKELEDKLISWGEKSYRAKQIFLWLHKENKNVDEMSNISIMLREKLKLEFNTYEPQIYKVFKSKIDETRKYLIKLNDGNIIESVLMKYKYGYTVCISSQVGCNMKCAFCASTINGAKRNLDVNELLYQIYIIEKYAKVKISNIVIMGSGEPLKNFDNIIKFFEIINDVDGKNISLRNITLSTCGIVENIYKLKDEKLPITLALSLHAPNDDLRNRLMPINKTYGLDKTLDAMADYYLSTKRKITMEYCLIKDVNSNKECAIELFNVLNLKFIKKHIDFNINLIPLNNVDESEFKRPDDEEVKDFYDYLYSKHINVTIRRELGKDINGACGQLRAKYIKE